MGFRGTLHPYQTAAVDLIHQRQGTLIALDPGLGKTVITLAALTEGRGDAYILVVVPSSILWQWESQVRTWTDDDVVVVAGTQPQREATIRRVHKGEFAWVIASYDMVRRDIETWLSDRQGRPFALVLDEATYVKSIQAKRTKAAAHLAARASIVLALTGTPIENGKLEELFTIMSMVDNTVFGRSFRDFEYRYIVRDYWGGVKYYRNRDHFLHKLGPAMVRKRQTDDDVRDFLPTVVRTPVPVPMPANFRRAYQHAEDYLVEQLDGIAVESVSSWNDLSNLGGVGAVLNYLRMLCSVPRGLHDTDSEHAAELVFRLGHHMPKVSPKQEVLVDLVQSILDEDDEHKVVVFTGFRRAHAEVMEACEKKEWSPAAVIGGQTPTVRRGELERFRSRTDCRVLVSTDAGGFGVDLPHASHLVNLDLPWSAGAWKQRDSRIVRASSRWPSVILHDIFLTGTVDEYVRDDLDHKRQVEMAFVDGEKDAPSERSKLSEFLGRLT